MCLWLCWAVLWVSIMFHFIPAAGSLSQHIWIGYILGCVFCYSLKNDDYALPFPSSIARVSSGTSPEILSSSRLKVAASDFCQSLMFAQTFRTVHSAASLTFSLAPSLWQIAVFGWNATLSIFKMLQYKYVLGKVGFDRAENEPFLFLTRNPAPVSICLEVPLPALADRSAGRFSVRAGRHFPAISARRSNTDTPEVLASSIQIPKFKHSKILMSWLIFSASETVNSRFAKVDISARPSISFYDRSSCGT